MVNQHLEEFQEEIEFNRLDWDNALISTVTNEEFKARITNLKKIPTCKFIFKKMFLKNDR